MFLPTWTLKVVAAAYWLFTLEVRRRESWAIFYITLCLVCMVRLWDLQGWLRTFQKFPPWLADPMPASFKGDSPLAKAKPTRDGGSISGIMYLARGEKTVQWQLQSRERNQAVG